MKKNGAIWVVLVVLAVAALLMYFVVLPQVRGGKAVDELAQKAGYTAPTEEDRRRNDETLRALSGGK